MLVATWNVDSIRARLPRVLAWLGRHHPDVLCLQETKVEDPAFPRGELEAAGYRVAFAGDRGRNGVAIASRLPLANVRIGFASDEEPAARRAIAASAGGVEVLCLYVPNGQSLGTEAYLQKIDWLVRLRAHLVEAYDPRKPLVVCGDFNVAPEDRDLWDERLRGGLHSSRPERDGLEAVLAWGLVDCLREVNQEARQFTWWPYGANALKRDQGLRIDLVLATKPLVKRLRGVVVDREERGGKTEPTTVKASDHAPLVATFDVGP